MSESRQRTSWIPYKDFYDECCSKFDQSFVNLLLLIQLNQGLWGMVVLACQDYFKVYLKLDPGQMTGLMSIVMFPWSVKILYGLISDNVPLLGTKRKSYIMLMGFIQFGSLVSIYAFKIQ